MIDYSHTEACRIVRNLFTSRDAAVQTEVPLPLGRGAVDVLVNRSGRLPLYIEVKSHPSSIMQGGVQKQLRRYEEHFPGGEYALAFPTLDGRIALVDFKTNTRTLLGVAARKEYLSRVDCEIVMH
jgi:hypothetical protein